MGCQSQRRALKGVYDSPKWATRVNMMTDEMVIYTFNRLRQQRKV